ncbi:DUF222 domain-containing protein [Nocardia sp. CDC153]|uniref:DUF222 domain-containing protein n=1 Tax=Nocardia sp. CDC153 TaxID=3112167 RepID=UPI002DBBA574|nr:DUF222 domain-containing protein [Nocardia sp. CDC153]MEC3952547.1 DUF222 domain-containing protein [Nocardia sp. CDC153]
MGEIAVEEYFSTEVVERLRAVHSQIAALEAEEVALMTLLYRRRREQQLELGVGLLHAGEDAATEIGIALKVSQRVADGLIDLGLGLENRYPATREAFAAGRIDLARARAISQTLTNVPEELLAELEPKVAAYAENADPQRVRRTSRRWLLERDPEGQARRRKAAEADRYVNIAAADDGTAVMDAVLPAAGGQTLYERLREMASGQVCRHDPRTTAQRRADALVALADGAGRLVCQCGLADCPRAELGETAPVARKALVQVGVSAAACDLDHQDRFDHDNPRESGRTTEENLGARCRRHHRLKTHADNGVNNWEVVHHPDRRVERRTPSGGSVSTTPGGVKFLFPTAVVPPVTAGGVPDAEPHGSVWDPGNAVNAMTEILHVYATPAQRREQWARMRARRNM